MENTQSQAPGGRKPLRMPVREGEVQLRPGEYQGRNGEILKRSPVKFGNPFDFPDDVKDPDWSYQWIRQSVFNSTEHSEMAAMKRAGWREVPPDGVKGYFKEEVPEGQNFIAREGLVLVERPVGMTEEAKTEALRAANKHYEGQIHKIHDENATLPSGFRALRGEIDREAPQAAPSEWKPQHRPRKIDPAD